MKQTYLVHIGYPKCASTWLQSSLFSGNHDPNIQPLIGYKEPNKYGYQKSGGRLFNIHDNDEHSDYFIPLNFNAKKAKDFLKTHSPNVHTVCLSNEAWSGHPFSGGCTGKEFADRIHQTIPNAKILIIIRNQVDMALSSYAHFLEKSGGTSSLKLFLSPKDNLQIPWATPHFFCYHLLIEYYISLFGKKNILVIPFESLTQDGEHAFIKPIYDFLSLSSPKNIDTKNVIKNTRNYKKYYVLKKLRWLNILSSPHPANGMIGLKQKHLTDILISTISRMVPNFLVKRKIQEDKKYIAKVLCPYIAKSNNITQKYLLHDLKKYNYEL